MKKIVLGTVQLGMKYGLANTHGQPTKDQAFNILDTALVSGIEYLDTAWAYGTSEDVIGEWIRNRPSSKRIKIISKLKPHVLNDYPDGTKAYEVLKKEVDKSLERLNIKVLDGYMLHSPYYVYSKHIMDGLKKIKEEGKVKNIGVSVYDEAEALEAVKFGVDYIQIPYNIFDQRLDKTDFFDLAEKNKVKVFARSPFLQGVLLMQPDRLPENLSYLRDHLEKLINIANKYNLTQNEIALKFVDLHSKADYIVFGVDIEEQLMENLKNINKILLEKDKDFIKEIVSSFKDLNKGAINPSLWSKIKN